MILAGGLSPENVHDALMTVKCAGADSCTQTNRVASDGNPVRFQKDFQRVADFVRAVRRADEALLREKTELEIQLETLRSELADREKALPAHSVRPHQIMAIEALEEDIESVEAELARFRMAFTRD
ncbi:MAG: hypothetical protein U5R49_01385 [Deltaproteobacteria bacterium]|nr:hypothetical protein [Deltaproteobacteria bacterium]